VTLKIAGQSCQLSRAHFLDRNIGDRDGHGQYSNDCLRRYAAKETEFRNLLKHFLRFIGRRAHRRCLFSRFPRHRSAEFLGLSHLAAALGAVSMSSPPSATASARPPDAAFHNPWTPISARSPRQSPATSVLLMSSPDPCTNKKGPLTARACAIATPVRATVQRLPVWCSRGHGSASRRIHGAG